MVFKHYAVLEKLLINHAKNQHLADFYIISVQHLLSSTGSMFETLVRYGFTPQHIFLTGKIYSTHAETKENLKQLGINIIESTISKNLGEYSTTLENDVKKMWIELEKALKSTSKIIILDDGGYTLKNAPNSIIGKHRVYGIEQTTSGIKMQKTFGKFPVIHLASCANKVIIEPKIVSEAIQLQLGKIIADLTPKSIGVIGYGHIGKAVVKEFKEHYKTFAFDIKNESDNQIFEGVEYCHNINDLIQGVDILIGATGQDISTLKWIDEVKKNLTLISVSSGDVEFNTLLKNAKSYLLKAIDSPLDVLELKTSNNSIITILRGGMVANFTGLADSSPGHIIQVTRGLLFSAIIQIVENENRFKKRIGAIMLSPILQKEVTKYWFDDQPQRKEDYSTQILKGFKNENWIKRNSNGLFIC